MAETWEDQRTRLEMMAADTWDLSQKERAAIDAVLLRLADAEARLAKARDYCRSPGAVGGIALARNVLDILEAKHE